MLKQPNAYLMPTYEKCKAEHHRLGEDGLFVLRYTSYPWRVCAATGTGTLANQCTKETRCLGVMVVSRGAEKGLKPDPVKFPLFNQ